jgi:hypothetical protein
VAPSTYAYSPFFTELPKANLLEFDGLTDPDFARVLEYVREQRTDYLIPARSIALI